MCQCVPACFFTLSAQRVTEVLAGEITLRSLPSKMNYCDIVAAGTTGIMRMAVNGEPDAYLAKLEVLQFSNYKDNPGTIKSLFNQFFAFHATDEERLLWRSIMHRPQAHNVSLYASTSKDTETYLDLNAAARLARVLSRIILNKVNDELGWSGMQL